MVSWGISSWIRTITELLDSVRCNLAALDGSKHNVDEVFYWILFRWALGPVSGMDCLHPPGTTCIISPHESGHCRLLGGTQGPLHQSDSGSKDFTQIPDGCQSIVVNCVEVCALKCYASPDHHWPTMEPVMLNNVRGIITGVKPTVSYVSL